MALIHARLPRRRRNSQLVSLISISAGGLVGWVAVLLLCAVAGCGDSGRGSVRFGPPELSHDGLPLRSANGTVLSESPLLGLPSDIGVVGPFLVLLDLASDSVVHVLDEKTGAHLAQLGARGEGPCEFKSVWTLDPVPGDSNLAWIYDIGLLRLTQIDVARSLREHRLACTHMLTMRSDAVPTGPVWLDGETMASLGFFPTARLGFFDSEGNLMGTAGAVPAGDGSMDAGVRQHAYQATLTKNPSANLLATATRHASLLEIYKTSGESVTVVEGPLTVHPQFGVGRSVRGLAMQTGRDLRFGYVDVTAGPSRIYALFSGRTREGYPKSAFQGRFIHMFDWEGQFDSALELDADIVGIVADESSESIFAIRHDPTPAVLRYRLSGGRR